MSASRQKRLQNKLIAKSSIDYVRITIRITDTSPAGKWNEGLSPGHGRYHTPGRSPAFPPLVDGFSDQCRLSALRHLVRRRTGDLWRWAMEPASYRGLGLGYHQLRLVGRYRSRRNPDLCHSITVPPGLAHGCEQGR